jgi:hypothetical protein
VYRLAVEALRIVKHLTRSDAIVLLFSILLLSNLAAVGTPGRKRAKQAVCLTHLKQLTHSWLSYAQDNDGKIVGGNSGFVQYPGDRQEKPWVGKCWENPYNLDTCLPQELQRAALEWGSLWPYVHEARLYRCPDGEPGHLLTYSIVDAMNGMARMGTSTGSPLSLNAKGVRIGDTVLWIKNLAEIISPGPAQRMVFIDHGWAWPGGFSVHYSKEAWWTPPPVRHWDGTSVTFADGHSEHWRWQGEETLSGRGRSRSQLNFAYTLPTPEDRDDLHRFQIAVWGRLGYEPSQ